MNNQIVSVICQECGDKFEEKKTWHGQSEICHKCDQKRTNRDNCKRHGGKQGLDCFVCRLEGKLNA